jgi:KUP system potassium uptake protein
VAGHHVEPGSAGYRLALALAALGVVYGDIGTSPLYALKECFGAHYGLAVTAPNVLGVLSLVFWALVVVISVKYLLFVMRADNEGEGGILALMALATRVSQGGAIPEGKWKRRAALIALGLFGSALLYGDGIITPAISVLSAVEGLKVATPVFEPYVVPITLGILVALFLVQSRGTARIGRIFGPVTLAWFTTLGVLGLLSILHNPGVLAAANPAHAVRFFAENGGLGFLVLGSVFLVVTGGEALYADMGHFGAGPIRLAWFTVVLPALLLNYFGQGALLLREPAAAENPLFHLVPDWGVIPLVVIATAATIIASQAVITGAFSLTMQAVQLGFSPRVRIFHTSRTEYGQVYIPSVNAALMVACLVLVVEFGSSSALAAAYGIAVTSTMAITTLLLFVVMRRRWKWALWAIVPLTAAFLVIDLAFFGANIVKVLQGGWVPLALAAVIYLGMATWRRGRQILGARLAEGALPLDLALPDLQKRATRVPGTAVYLHGNPHTTPPALLHNLKHFKVLHERVVLLRVEVLDHSHVTPERRFDYEPIAAGFHRVTLRYGFAEVPDVGADLQLVPLGGRPLGPLGTTYFLGRERVLASERPGGMALWRERLFAYLSNNAANAADFFGLPPNQVVEIGARIEI